MKKITSVFLSLMFIITTISIGSITAFAETTSKYWEPLPHCQDFTPCVNDIEFGGVIGSSYDETTGQHTFTYEGEGVVTGWEFPLSQEGKDYEFISQNENHITIKIVNEDNVLPYINAIVDFDETSSQTTQTEQQTESTSSTSVSKTQETTTNATAEKNDNLNTVKILIPALAVVCIAVIVIIAIKKHKK